MLLSIEIFEKKIKKNQPLLEVLLFGGHAQHLSLAQH
jgi:hypothetical protein